MNRRSNDGGNVAVGLDLGSTKIAVVIAELDAYGRMKIIGVGHCPSEGLRRGVVVDVDKTVLAIRRAVQEAELMSGVDVLAVNTAVAGEHIGSLNSRGVVAVSGMGGEISESDKARVIEAARAVTVAGGNQVLHVLPQEFYVDGQGGIHDPVGIAGVRLEADVHMVTGSTTAIQNIRNSIVRAGLTVHEVVLQPLAASHAVLSDEEREMGVCLIDIGGGTTDVALFSLGSIHHTRVLGLGGHNVTTDIAVGLRTAWTQAEAIKRGWGAALPDMVTGEETVEVPGIAGRQPHRVERRKLASIIGMRMEEIFALVRDELRAAGFTRPPGAGVVLTGGGALIHGSAELAEGVFDLPVRIGYAENVAGVADRISTPDYATAVGLACMGLSRLAVDAGGQPGGAAWKARRSPVWWRTMVEWIQALL